MADTLGESLVFLLQEPGGTLAGDGSAIAVLQVELVTSARKNGSAARPDA